MVGLIVWLISVALAVVICVAVICAVRRPMRELLGVNSYISPARKFYLRAFTVLVFLAALATISKTDIPTGDEGPKAFMEYVWWVVGAVQPVFSALSFGLIIYAALLAVLFVVLGRYRD